MITAGSEPLSAPVHNLPTGVATRDVNAQLQAQVKSRTQAIRYHLMADVLYAVAGSVAGIPILGPAVSHALSNWADDLESRATAAIVDSANAQSTATYATTQVTVLATTVAALGTTTGVSYSDEFSGASANTLGSSWARTSSGSGAGNFGPNGSGRAVWKKSGVLTRTHIDRWTSPLNTDYQAVVTVIGKPPEADIGYDNGGITLLIARCNADATTYVWARIRNNSLAIGKTSGGSGATWATASVTINAGDQITFLIGTGDAVRQVIVKQNGIVRLNYVDVSSSDYGADYRYTGLISSAVQGIGTFQQLAPAELNLWSATDRSPTAI